MSLDHVIGNETARNLLGQALKTGRIGHAYIIEGNRGTGRMTLAKAFAAELLKAENPETHPDFTIVTNQWYDPTKKQENVLIETVRAMKKDAYIRPYAGEKKVYLMPLADSMQAPAQNSLLKVLEEPPAYCVILLLAENANAFLPTILSRAQVIRTQPVLAEQVEKFLIEHRQIAKSKAGQLAILSGGAIGKALELLEDEEATELREETLKRFFAILDGTYKDMYDFVKFLKQHKADISLILEVLLSWGRDVMHWKLRLSGIPLMNGDKEEELERFCHKLPRESALKLNEITVRYQKMIEQNVNYSAAVLCMVTEYWEEIHGRNTRS